MYSKHTHAALHAIRVRQVQQDKELPVLSSTHRINTVEAGDAWKATASIVFSDPPSD